MREFVGLAAAIVLFGGTGAPACADEPAVMPPAGTALLLDALGDGVQIYTCDAANNGFSWNFKAPEANLFDQAGREIGTHFAGPTWKLDDGSAIVGEVVARADAPQPGAIPWLLLRVKSYEGAGRLSNVAFVRRAETLGGAAPETDCDASHVAQSARMRYSARYQFFGAAK